MLILTRGFQEKIIIGDNVEIKVLEISEQRIRLGVTAPKNIAIRRGRKMDQDKVSGDGER